MNYESVNKLIEKSVRENWERPSLSNYQGATLYYKDIACLIEKLHILYEKCGLDQGDKVAISSRNQANWPVAFLSAMTYGAVPVPLLHEFKSGTVHNLVNESDTKILFVDDVIWEGLDIKEMPEVQIAILVNDLSILYSKVGKAEELTASVEKAYAEKYPEGVKPSDLDYHLDSPEELAIINYTSGTSGFSKGAMIPYRAICSNIQFSRIAEPQLNNQMNLVSMLPTAHMYGMLFEFFIEFLVGMHIHFLTRVPSPKVILGAMQDIKPDLMVAVPLIIEKVYKSKVKPVIGKAPVKYLIKIPGINQIVYKKVRKQLVEAFGGQFEEIIIGGAGLNKEVDQFLHKIKFPYTVGYGMTECAPIIGYAHWNKARVYSCGKLAPNLEMQIDSVDPLKVPGELLLRGENVFLGYYKNPEATKAAFTKDGWFRTGDMCVTDKDGYIYIMGRNKCMILGPSGQNIYPEEIEGAINNIDLVSDSLVIEDKGSLVALIYPDAKVAEAAGYNADEVKKQLNAAVAEVCKELPAFSRVNKVEILSEDFERTPKKSIKRYLYQRS